MRQGGRDEGDRKKPDPIAKNARRERTLRPQDGSRSDPAEQSVDVAFAPEDAEGLESATAAELEPIEISQSGLGIHFPKLDADLYLPALLEGFLGSRQWMAARLGTTGGQSRSAAKRKAAKKNGKLGSQPKKRVA